jgi:hypothetical protein
MRRRVNALGAGRVFRDELAGLFASRREENTEEFGARLWGDFE